MRIKTYFKEFIWDYLLCTLMLCSFNLTILSGFYIAPSLQFNYVLLIVMALILNALLFLGSYNKKSILIAIGVFIILAIGFLVFAQQNSSIGNVFKDVETNPYLYFIITTISAIGLFLLSRTKTGVGILFVVGTLVIAMIQLLYTQNHIIALLIYVCSCGALFMYKNYLKNALNSQTVKTSFGRSFGISALLCMLIVALSAGIFVGIDTIFDPPAKELKLITRYLALETIEKIGVADTTKVPDYKKETNDLSDDEEALDGQEKDKQEDGNNKLNEDEKKDRLAPRVLDLTKDAYFYTVTYLKKDYRWLFLLLLIVLLIISPFVIKLWSRKRWIKQLSSEDSETQVKTMYQFYIKKFKAMKMGKQPEDTLFQYIEKNRESLKGFAVENVTFANLTDTYVKTSFGEKEVPPEELTGYLSFHEVFYKNCREYLGKFKYILKFFSL